MKAVSLVIIDGLRGYCCSLVVVKDISVFHQIRHATSGKRIGEDFRRQETQYFSNSTRDPGVSPLISGKLIRFIAIQRSDPTLTRVQEPRANDSLNFSKGVRMFLRLNSSNRIDYFFITPNVSIRSTKHVDSLLRAKLNEPSASVDFFKITNGFINDRFASIKP